MRYILIISAFSFLGVNAQDCNLPADLKSQLKAERPSSQLLSESQLVPNWNEFLETSCPTIAQGDFNGDMLVDYAFLLSGDSYELLVFLSANDSYQIHSIMEIGFGIYDTGLGWGIRTYRERILDDSLKLSTDGIYFEKFESSSSVYYWGENKFKQAWLSD